MSSTIHLTDLAHEGADRFVITLFDDSKVVPTGPKQLAWICSDPRVSDQRAQLTQMCDDNEPVFLPTLGHMSHCYRQVSEHGPSAMAGKIKEIERSVRHFHSDTLFVVFHDRCAGCSEYVIAQTPEAESWYNGRLKPEDDPEFFVEFQINETRIQWEHWAVIKSILEQAFPQLKIVTLRKLRGGPIVSFEEYTDALEVFQNDPREDNRGVLAAV